MFQDSVPAGSYNDPFLSSVCVCVFIFLIAGGSGVTLVPVPAKMARCHSDIRGGRPFDVPAVVYLP